MKNWKKVISFTGAVAVIPAVALALTLSSGSGSPAGVPVSAISPLPLGPIGPGVSVPPIVGQILPSTPDGPVMTTPEEAVQRVRANTAEAKTVTGATAKATTWGQFADASASKAGTALQVGRLNPVWAVEIVGTFVPEFARGKTYPWGIVVFDKGTNAVLTTLAGPGAPPSWFDGL